MPGRAIPTWTLNSRKRLRPKFTFWQSGGSICSRLCSYGSVSNTALQSQSGGSIFHLERLSRLVKVMCDYFCSLFVPSLTGSAKWTLNFELFHKIMMELRNTTGRKSIPYREALAFSLDTRISFLRHSCTDKQCSHDSHMTVRCDNLLEVADCLVVGSLLLNQLQVNSVQPVLLHLLLPSPLLQLVKQKHASKPSQNPATLTLSLSCLTPFRISWTWRRNSSLFFSVLIPLCVATQGQ